MTVTPQPNTVTMVFPAIRSIIANMVNTITQRAQPSDDEAAVESGDIPLNI